MKFKFKKGCNNGTRWEIMNNIMRFINEKTTKFFFNRKLGHNIGTFQKDVIVEVKVKIGFDGDK